MEEMHFTDHIEVTIKIDEPDVGNKLPAVITKLRELIGHLEDAQIDLPAFPSGGASNNDTGFMHYTIHHNYYMKLPEEVQ